MMMKFLPAIGERKYDNEKRQVTFLSFPPLPFFLVITPLFVLLTLVKDENILQWHKCSDNTPNNLSLNLVLIRIGDAI